MIVQFHQEHIRQLLRLKYLASGEVHYVNKRGEYSVNNKPYIYVVNKSGASLITENCDLLV